VNPIRPTRSWQTAFAAGAAAMVSWARSGWRRLPVLRADRGEGPGAPGYTTCQDAETGTGIRCLGLFPEAAAADREGAPSAVAVEDPASALAAAFRRFRTTFVEGRPQVQVIALTSALPGDGKTTCTLGLARQSALEGHRTVLVDCDLRRRSSTAELQPPPTRGLLEVIYGGCTLDEALVRDRLTPLCVLPVAADMAAIARATNQDVFAADEMLQLMATLRQRFDYVFLDTPPLLALVDARRLAPLVDTFLLLARWGTTPKLAIANAIHLLRSTGAPLAGLVLTRTLPTQGATAEDESASPEADVLCTPDASGAFRANRTGDAQAPRGGACGRP
jgi:succinoglycan biosynthesis transport protein ExoP